MTCLELGQESASKVQKWKRHCFLKSYVFHSLQGVFNANGNLCDSLWITYFTRFPYQIKRINWLEINSYFTRYQTFIQQGFFNNYLSWVFFTIKMVQPMVWL
jgi:hypothetical protein